jgi:hypothetical protein
VLLSEGFNRWVLDERYLALAPTDEQRAWMKIGFRAFQSYLKPATPDHIRTQLMSMFVTMKQRNPGTSSDARKVVETYIADLAGVPLQPFLEACAALRRGDVGEGWMPTPAELCQETNLRAIKPRQQLADLTTILGARIPKPPDSPEKKQAVFERWYHDSLRAALANCAWPTGPNTVREAPKSTKPEPLPEPGTVVLPPPSARLRAILARQNAERFGVSAESNTPGT